MKKKVETKVKVKVNINVGVNNVQGSLMPEMNDPFYTLLIFWAQPPADRQKMTGKEFQSVMISSPCMRKCSVSQAGIKM